jgi:hypothetical protein
MPLFHTEPSIDIKQTIHIVGSVTGSSANNMGIRNRSECSFKISVSCCLATFYHLKPTSVTLLFYNILSSIILNVVSNSWGQDKFKATWIFHSDAYEILPYIARKLLLLLLLFLLGTSETLLCSMSALQVKIVPLLDVHQLLMFAGTLMYLEPETFTLIIFYNIL